MTKQEYIDLHKSCQDFMRENEITTITTTGEPEECSLDQCGCCGTRTMGHRWPMVAWSETSDTTTSEVFCTDCMNIATHGEIDDLTMLDLDIDDYTEAQEELNEYGLTARDMGVIAEPQGWDKV